MKTYAKWKKPATKGNILHDPIYMSRTGKSTETERVEKAEGENGEWQVSFWSDKNKLDYGDVAQYVNILKKHWIVSIKQLNFIVCKLCINKAILKNKKLLNIRLKSYFNISLVYLFPDFLLGRKSIVLFYIHKYITNSIMFFKKFIMFWIWVLIIHKIFKRSALVGSWAL